MSHCLKCRKNTESKNPKFVKIENGRIMVTSTCAVSGSKKSRFIKEQEAKEMLHMISKNPVGSLLIWLKLLWIKLIIDTLE